MNLQFPVEIVAGVLIFMLSIVWKSYRSMWQHIARIEKKLMLIMIMLGKQGHSVPTKSDTEIFLRTHNLDDI